MTNFELLIKLGQKDKDKAIQEVSLCLANIAAKIVKRMCMEQYDGLPGVSPVEISNFDIADMKTDFTDFFNREINGNL